MDRETVYRKTALGVEAIARRDPSLPPRDRSVLIMVDGHRKVGELATLGNAEETLSALLARGFIAPVLEPAASGPAAETATRPQAASPPLSLEQAQKLAVRRLNELLGPAAADLCIRLEQARRPEEFLAALRRMEDTLKLALGPQASSRLLREVGQLRAS